MKWILVLVVVAASIIVGVKVLGGENVAYEVDRVAVENGPITMTVETLGTVEPLSTITIGCETTGKIVEILVDYDEPVKMDQIICRIDPALADAQHEQSVAGLRQAKSAVVEAKIAREELNANLPVLTAQALGRSEEARAALVQAEFNWKRIDKLFQNNQAVEAEWINAKAAFARAKAAVTIAKAAHDMAVNSERFSPKRADEAVEQAEAAERLAQALFNTTNTQVDKCIIRSPIDGIVLKRFMDVGTTVNATFQSPPLFLIAPGLDYMRVNAKVSESDISYIEVGQTARFTVEGRSRSRFEGKILHKRNQPVIIQNVVTYTVMLEVDNDQRRTLLPGMTVNVEIVCVHRPDALRISNRALRFNPPLTSEERSAMLEGLTWPDPPLDADGRKADYSNKGHAWTFDEQSGGWQPVPLWVGVTDNLHTEVLSGAASGVDFVKRFLDKSSSGFSFKDAMKLADPGNRTL